MLVFLKRIFVPKYIIVLALCFSVALCVPLFLGKKADTKHAAASGLTIDPNLRSVRVNNYNNWNFRITSPTTKTTDISKTLADKLSILSNYQELNYGESWDPQSISTSVLKNANPNLILYRMYTLNLKPSWDTDWNDSSNLTAMQYPLTRAQINDPNNIRGGAFDQNATDDWWMRDSTGAVVKESDSQWFVDIGKPGVKEAYLQSLISRNSSKGFEGFVFDYWWPTMMSSWVTVARGYDIAQPGYAYPNDAAWYTNAWKPFIQYVMTGLHQNDYKIIGNCAGEYGATDPYGAFDLQRSLIDGTVYEQGAMDWPTGNNPNHPWIDGSAVQNRIDSLRQDPLVAWIGTYGLRKYDSNGNLIDSTLYNQERVMDLSFYYISLPSDTDLQQKRSYHYYRDDSIFWDNLWDFYIGHPAKDYVKNANQYFWNREFTLGLVLLNYESNQTIDYQLTNDYIDQDGNSYSAGTTVHIPAHSGKIFQRASLSQPQLQSSTSGFKANQTSYNFSGHAEPNANIQLTVHSDPIELSTVANESGQWSITLNQALPAGDHTIDIASTVDGVNSTPSQTYTFSVANDSSSQVDNNNASNNENSSDNAGNNASNTNNTSTSTNNSSASNRSNSSASKSNVNNSTSVTSENNSTDSSTNNESNSQVSEPKDSSIGNDISLNSQTNDAKVTSPKSKRDIVIYVLVGSGVVVGIFFLIKYLKNKNSKNKE